MRFFIIFIFPLFLFAKVDISIAYYKDINKTKNIQDILFLPNSAFSNLKSVDLGLDTANYWLKIKVDSNLSKKVVLEFLDSRIDEISLYDSNGGIISKQGDYAPFKDKIYNDSNSVFILQTSTLYYLKVFTKYRMSLEYIVWENERDYLSHLEVKNLFKSFYFGALLIMFLYNLIIYLFLRERVFLEYVVYHVSFTYTMIFYTGLYGQLFFPELDNLNYATVSLHVAAFSTMMAVQFFRSFLNTTSLVPKIDIVLKWFIYLQIVVFLLDMVDVGYIYNQIVFNLSMMLMSIFLLILSLYIAIVKQNKTGYFYFLGWLMMMVGIVLTSLTVMNIIPRNDFTSNIFQIGSLFEVTLLSMGLAYRYKLKQEDLAKKNIIIQKQAKLVSMGEMLQNISHQWRQPLSEINAVMMKIDADFYKKRLTSDSLEEDITKVEMLTRHMSETISSFNNYLKVNSQNSDTLVNLEEIVKQAIRILDTRLKDVQVEVEAEKLESMQLNSSDLIQVLHVLLANAVDTFESRDQTLKIITIRLKKRDEKVLIEVEDNAGGVESKNLEKIFEPYFTTKFQSDGIGIGLYMARMLVENSLGGQIYVQNTKTGAKFSIEI